MMNFVCAGAEAAGVLSRVIAVHCDLGRMEWKGTKELAKKHCRHFGIPIRIVRRENGDLLQQVRARGMWPDSRNRYCTSDQKRDQVKKLITALTSSFIKANFSGTADRPVRILNCLGFRAEESAARAKKEIYQVNRRVTNGKRIVFDWLPIHAWKVTDVWASIKASRVSYHHAYDLGMPRLSCCFCIFASSPALMIAGKHNPELLSEYVEVEKAIGHTFRHGFSIASIKARLDAGEQAPASASSWAM